MNYSKIVDLLPSFVINWGVSIYNLLAYRKRYGGKYKLYRKLYLEREGISLAHLKKIQSDEYRKLVEHAISHSLFYQRLYKSFSFDIGDIKNITKLPIVTKEDLRLNINDVYTISKKNASIGKTGGTTGKSLVVRNTLDNAQERFALLDNFRAKQGYKLGRKTAWFSGKKILNKRDLKRHQFWKTDYIYKVRYYSTFHIATKNLSFYLDNLLSYAPEYIVGFPSSIYDIAKEGLRLDKRFDKGVVKAIFPTAETITEEHRKVIESFFNTKLYDQYASSEGAPFIFECKYGKKHVELQSGVFEVLDENNKPSRSGRLVVTSFTTYGTPLIRYDIGDTITLEDTGVVCKCGNYNPLVKEILGRIDDYIYSQETGKINLGNLSNATKGVNGIVQFQVHQNELNAIDVFIVKDDFFSGKDEDVFLENLQDRLGEKMKIKINYVTDIPVEKSGKFRLIKNNIKDQIE